MIESIKYDMNLNFICEIVNAFNLLENRKRICGELWTYMCCFDWEKKGIKIEV